MTQPKRRKQPRCEKNAAIIYTFLNQTRQYKAITRNISRYGMYFETAKLLQPGTLIVIRHDTFSADAEREADQTIFFDPPGSSDACRELKTQVVGEVKRCEKLEETAHPRYGIAVHYISPAT